ncbi:MAG: UDP-3-O-(3-hydroxymyristoyl)glucosamine N-acyltransferase [Planctomycetota bacterium]
MPTTFSVHQIAEWTGGRVVNATVLGDALASIVVSFPAGLAGSTSTDVSYFFNIAYKKELATAAPGILITGDRFVEPLESAGLPLWKKTAVIACSDPYMAMAVLSEKFALAQPEAAQLKPVVAGIHPTAVISPSAEIDPSASIGAHCVVEDGVKVGKQTALYPGVFLGANCQIGDDCVFFMGVKIYARVQIGSRVRIHANAVLGADGFGYAPRFEAGKPVGHQKIYHLGIVVVCDDVEIGAGTCIDRATFGETRIERFAKIDNLVMIGHNCRIGEGAVLCGKVGMAGSSSVGKFAYVGGAAGITNMAHVGDFAKVGGLSGISKDVPSGQSVTGNPQRELREHLRLQASFNRLIEARNERRNARKK